MRKSIRILAVALVAVMLCLSLASCGDKLSGTYEAEFGGDFLGYVATYKFSGKKVEITKTGKILGTVESKTFEGTYEIEDEKITISLEEEDDDIKSGTFTFAETEEGIKMGLVEYKKK